MSDDLALRAIETRIDAVLFGRRYWASPRWREADRRKLISVSREKEDVPEGRVEITPVEAATCADIWCHHEYCSDWSAFPRLLDRCIQQEWWFSAAHDRIFAEPWEAKLLFCKDASIGPDGEWWFRTGRGETLSLALCHAIVAVLDATEEIENSKEDS